MRMDGAPGMSGPRVWLDLDQEQLDAAYDQSRYAPNQPQVLQRYTANSELFRARYGAPRRECYGVLDVEQLDIHSPVHGDAGGAPIQVFIHGGAWRSGLAKNYAFLAEPFIHAGALFIVPDFSWVQDVHGDLRPIASQLRQAMAWIHANAPAIGGDPQRIYLSGHSSGAHLAAVLLATDWEAQGLPAGLFKGGLCCSGLYDLEPVALSSRNSYLRLPPDIQQAMSPQRRVAQLDMPVVVAYGSLETPEFQRQSHDFAAIAQQAGKDVELLRAEAYNHFEILETMANPYGLLGCAALSQMGLGGAPER